MRYSEYRQQAILDVLRESERVSVNSLAAQLDVSPESIRRDLRQLELQGSARRVYGGAILKPAEGDRPFGERSRVNVREKVKIGESAARLIENGMKIFVGSGTTTLACVKHLSAHRELTIVTNSIAVAAHFFSRSWGTSVRVLGGPMVPEYQATFGHTTLASMAEHRFDIALLGASAVNLEQGFMGYGEDEVVMLNAARANANRTIVVADSSKFGRFGAVRAFGLGDVHTVVTSGKLADDFVAAFSQSNVHLVQA